jgi:hypothetical protein
MGAVDSACELPQPPAGGLILKLYARPLGWDGNGDLRQARADEFIRDNPGAEDSQIKLQASPDFMWLRRAEWQMLVPANPRLGEEHAVPVALMPRLFC